MPEKKSPKNNKKNGDIVKDIQKAVIIEFNKLNISKVLYNLKAEFLDFIARLKKIGNFAENNYLLGKKHYKLRNYEDAVFRFKFVLWLEPENYNAWYWLGLSYIKLGKKPSGRNSFKKALKLRPDFEEARDALKSAAEVKVEPVVKADTSAEQDSQ